VPVAAALDGPLETLALLERVRSALALVRDVAAAIPALQSAEFDDARSIRELARHELSKRDHTADFAPGYRRAVELRQGRDRTIAIEGLAEIGSREDVPLFLRFFEDPNARVRAAAIVGIGRCDGSNHLDELEAALLDGSSLVRRAVNQYANLYLGRGFARRVREAVRARAGHRAGASGAIEQKR
jgi:HEAT repeat protein